MSVKASGDSDDEQSLIELMAAGAPAGKVDYSWWSGKITAVGDRNIERDWSGNVASISTSGASSSTVPARPAGQENRVDQTREANKDDQAGCCQFMVWAVVIFSIYCMAVGGNKSA